VLTLDNFLRDEAHTIRCCHPVEITSNELRNDIMCLDLHLVKQLAVTRLTQKSLECCRRYPALQLLSFLSRQKPPTQTMWTVPKIEAVAVRI
jgi:hypothetical protein